MASVGRPPTIDQPRRRQGLHDTVLASPAGIFGPNCAHTISSRSLLSSPIRCNSPWQHGQVLSSMSTTISIRGRCAGGAPRLIRRLSARPVDPPATNHQSAQHGWPRPARRLQGPAASGPRAAFPPCGRSGAAAAPLIWRSRSFCTRSASSTAFSVSGSRAVRRSASPNRIIRPKVATTCQAPDSLRRRIIHQPGCMSVAVLRAS